MGSGSSGTHIGRPFAVVVRLFIKRSLGKVGGERVDRFVSFDGETIKLCSVGMANVVTSREETKQMIKTRAGIEGPNAVCKVDLQMREGLERRETEYS